MDYRSKMLFFTGCILFGDVNFACYNASGFLQI